MTVIDWPTVQKRLGVAADGVPGVGTYTALFDAFSAMKARSRPLAVAASVHFPSYEITTPPRLAHFMAQIAHESGGFRWMREIWGPTPAQTRYDGRADLGNTEPGDGKRYMGRGPIQITGRANYRKFGRLIGLDIEENPELAEHPSIGLLLACEYWRGRNINADADRNDGEAVTRAINGGLNGYADRMLRLAKYQALIGE